MRIVFFGTGKFGIPSLKRLVNGNGQLMAVVTRPEKKQGRGWNVKPSPVKATIEQIAPGLPVLQPETFKDADFDQAIKGFNADIFIVIDYGRKLPRKILELPEKYCINLHPSLLPAYRGAAPVNWAIIRGEKETGNTVFRMSEKMDSGDIIAQEKVAIAEHDNAEDLYRDLSLKGADLLARCIDIIKGGKEELRPQEEHKATIAPKLRKEDGRIDWTRSVVDIERMTRGLVPWPGAFTYIGGKMLKIFEARIIDGSSLSSPGTILDAEDLTVVAGDGILKLEKVQLEGRRMMDKKEFLRGHSVEAYTVLGK